MSDLLENMNEAQCEAITHEDGPLLIVAGAGTGKTTVLTRRYVHLKDRKNLMPENILALTFTEKAAGEMEDRILELLPNGTYDFWIHTFHGFCQRVLEDHALEIGLPNTFRLLNETDAWLLLKRRFDELPLDHYRPLGNPVKFLQALIQHISRAKDEGITPEDYAAYIKEAALVGDADTIEGERKRLQELADAYAAYRRILLDEGALDFGDLILETLRLFRERPMVLRTYQEQCKFLMVDEFQDTNWAQYELLKMLARPSRNITVVGDDDQAIYKFRGASLANILQFRDDYPDAKTVALTQNYRSQKEILDHAYHFIKNNNPNRLEVKLADTGLSKELKSVRGAGGNVDVLWHQTIDDEAEAVVEDIKSKKEEDPSLTWDDIAVLVRSNNTAEPFVRAFDRMGIPFQFLALRGLYAKPTILDVHMLLRLMSGHQDSSIVWRALGMPSFNVSAKDKAELLHQSNRRGMSLWQILTQVRSTKTSDDGTRIVERLVKTIETLSEDAKREPPLKILQLVLEKTEYLDMVMRLPEREKREALQYLNAFADRIRRYEHSTHGPSLQDFLAELELELESGEEGNLNSDPDAGPELVKIMTVHAAKGLEFKHVYLVSMVDQRFPTRARSEAIPLPDGLVRERLPEGNHHIEEERRLFYVALTRAKDTLTLTGALQYGGAREKKASPFLQEMDVEIPSVQTSAEDGVKRLQHRELDPETFSSDLVHYSLKKRFSFTQLAAFRKCPLQYKFEHIYRIPKFGTFNKSFGQSVHLTFQNMLGLHHIRMGSVQSSLFDAVESEEQAWSKDALRITLDEAMAIFQECWIDEWYESREQHDEFFEKGKQTVRAFWKAYEQSVPDIAFVEKPFTLALGQHSIKGKIDRIDQLADGTFAVYDYKTGQAKDTIDAEAKEQLYLYQVALEEEGKTVSKLAYVYVLDWKELEVEPLREKKREAFLKKIESRMEAIITSDFHPEPDPFSCRYCDFKSICEFKKL